MTMATKVFAAKINSLIDPARFAEGYAAVSRQRQQKIDRLIRPDDKRRSLAASLLLRHVLRDCGVEQPSFYYNENGKPYIDGRDDLFFSLSHSGDTVMCAVSPTEVGCDVQKITDMDLRVAARLSTAEQATIAAASPDKQRELFFRLWTLKESFLKATGLGLSLPLSRFTIAINGDDIRLSQNLTDDTFYFKEYPAFDNCCFAVCATTPTFGDLTWLTLTP